MWLHYWYDAVGSFSNVLLIAQDLSMYKTMSKLLPGQVLLEPAALVEKDMNANPAGFLTQAFGQRVKRRFYQLATLASAGVNVLYSDADAILFCNLFEWFSNSTKVRAPIDIPPDNYNSGLIYAPDTPDSLQLLLLADAIMAVDPAFQRNDQPYFNKAIAHVADYGFEGLTWTHFPNAPHIWKDMKNLGVEAAIRDKCYAHNNFIVGKSAKMARFVQFGINKNPATDSHPGFQELRDLRRPGGGT
jgi:hypothetical protein